ncbi:33K [Skunk adenovirus HUN/2009]|nr:33K [Skunk adenovirus HUN/2009]UWY10655.1 33K [Skunk adenovirus 1]
MSSPDQKEEQESLSLEEVSDTEEEEYLESLPELPTIESKDTASLVKRAPRWDQKLKAKKAAPRVRAAAAEDNQETRSLRNRIFPTLYAIFQQSRGCPTAFKIKNRSLRSLLKSCLYHKNEAQLLRTQDDAEALLNKYCQSLVEPEE